MKTILVECFTPVPCPTDKVVPFTAAYNADANKLQVDYNYTDAAAHADMFKRLAMYGMGGTQQPRYMGKYGAVGSVWADSINGGLQDWKAATDAKVAEMMAVENDWDVVASHTEVNGVISVKVTGNSNKQTKCNLVVLLADGNKFKQMFVKQVVVPVSKKTLSVMFAPVSTGLKVIVMLQSLTEYTPDGTWGVQEREVYCVAQSVKK